MREIRCDKKSCKNVFVDEKQLSLEELSNRFKKRGNRLEVMNGKAYEVTRRYVRDVEQ